MNVAYQGRHFANCNDVAPILHRLADKWSFLIIMVLATGNRHFNQLRREITGISQRMLTRSLRRLERDGLISRTRTEEASPRVIYALTDLGQSLCVPINAIGTWALANFYGIRDAQDAYDAEHPDEDLD